MKLTLRKALFSGIAALALVAAPRGFAQTNNPTYPFKGIVDSVDKTAKTISLKKKGGERVLKIDSSSQLLLEGKPAILSDLTTNLYAHGTLHKGGADDEFIVKADFDKEAPAKKGSTNSVAGGTNTVSADPAPPVKKHKKKPAPDTSGTNSVPPTQ